FVTSGQFVGSEIVVNLNSAHPIKVARGGSTPELAPGTYTVGLASVCQPPDDLNNPHATFQTGGELDISVFRTTGTGYWMVGIGGNVYAFGAAARLGDARTAYVSHIEPTPMRAGYWIVNALGQVFAFGDALWKGNAAGLAPGEAVTSLSSTLSGRG